MHGQYGTPKTSHRSHRGEDTAREALRVGVRIIRARVWGRRTGRRVLRAVMKVLGWVHCCFLGLGLGLGLVQFRVRVRVMKGHSIFVLLGLGL